MDIREYRKSDLPVNKIFLERWSPRAMSGEELTDQELFTLFEAARWAPSSYNAQPWRILYAKRNTPYWDAFFSLLVEFNQRWAKSAAVLLVFISRKSFEHNGKPSVTHSFDAGAAWENLAMQASLNGLVAHGMEGFDYEKAKKSLAVPEDYQVEAMIALGKPGRKENLPDKLQEREFPSNRKPLSEIVMEGKFRA